MKKGTPLRIGDGRDFIPEDIIGQLDRHKDGLVWCARCQRVWYVDDLLFVGSQVLCADPGCDGRLTNLRGYTEHRWRLRAVAPELWQAIVESIDDVLAESTHGTWSGGDQMGTTTVDGVAPRPDPNKLSLLVD